MDFQERKGELCVRKERGLVCPCTFEKTFLCTLLPGLSSASAVHAEYGRALEEERPSVMEKLKLL